MDGVQGNRRISQLDGVECFNGRHKMDFWGNSNGSFYRSDWEEMNESQLFELLITAVTNQNDNESVQYSTAIALAVQAARQGQEVYAADCKNGIGNCFAVGIRYVDKNELPFDLEQVTEEASDGIGDYPGEMDDCHDVLLDRFWSNLLNKEIAMHSGTELCFDVLANYEEYKSEAYGAWDDWAAHMRDHVLSEQIRQDFVDRFRGGGDTLRQQFQSESDRSFEELISTMTPRKAREVANSFRGSEISDQEPLRSFIKSLSDLAESYGVW
jgi:hypothetical protein